MGKFTQVTSAFEALPEARREEIAAIIEALFHGDLHPESALSDEQIADLRTRLANPGPIATDAWALGNYQCETHARQR